MSQHRLLCCGDRNWTSKRAIRKVLKEYPEGTLVIQGMARGADTLAGEVAKELGFKVMEFPALWERYGRAAGPIRNQQMLDRGCPTQIIAFHTNIEASTGTADMIRRAKKANKPVLLITKE